jgi:hypothetical protein
MRLNQTNWREPETQIDEATALLIRARALVARGWCQETNARNFLGFRVSPYSRWATSWCPSGAIRAARAGASGLDVDHAVRRLTAEMGALIPVFTDRQKTVEPVLAAFDRAIAARSR